MLTIIDMGMGNLQSICCAVRNLGFEVCIANKVREVEVASSLILPGVGAFGYGMTALQQANLVEPLQCAVLQRKVPLLGICIGMQLLAQSSEEFGYHQGLGFIPGRIVPLSPLQGLVLNMGWQRVEACQGSTEVFPTNEENIFYFAHSYHLICNDTAMCTAVTAWGANYITAAIHYKNIWGVQFHPEKSQDTGLNFLYTVLKNMQTGD